MATPRTWITDFNVTSREACVGSDEADNSVYFEIIGDGDQNTYDFLEEHDTYIHPVGKDISNKEHDTYIHPVGKDISTKPEKQSFRRRMCVGALVAVILLLVISIATAAFLLVSSKSETSEDNGGRCPEYTNIENGNVVNITGTKHGDAFEIECDERSKLIGPNLITCLSSNRWSANPECSLKTCSDFVVPNHMQKETNTKDSVVGTEIKVSCTEGFQLLGSKTITCQRDESWSDVPVCKAVDCGVPGNIANADIIGLFDTTFNNTFSVVCIEGHQLNGQIDVRCTSAGWDKLPTCTRVSCGLPDIPAHGSIRNITGMTYQSVATIKCDKLGEGVNQYEDSVIICQANGSWTEAASCDVPDIPQNQLGTRFITGFMYAGVYSSVSVPQLFVVSSVSSTTNVNVTIPFLGIRDQHHTLKNFLVLNYTTSLLNSKDNDVSSKAVEVTSDQPIALFSLIRYTDVASDGTLTLPTSALGQLYIVGTYDSTYRGFSQVLVIAMYDYTNITYEFPSGTTFNLTLNKLETYRLVANTSEPLAGTMIFASSKIAVHAGHPCATIPGQVSNCDVLEEAVPAVKNLGRKFVVPYLIPRSTFSIGVAAPYDNTNITIYNSNTGTSNEIFQLNKGGSVTQHFKNNSIIFIEATQNILLSQYSQGYVVPPHIGDPSLLYIPAITQFGSIFHFVVPPFYVDARISIILDVTNTSHDVTNFRLNGIPPTNFTMSDLLTVPSIGSFYVCYIEVSVGVKYQLSHTNPDARFGAMLYAYKHDNQYLTTLGYNFNNGITP